MQANEKVRAPLTIANSIVGTFQLPDASADATKADPIAALYQQAEAAMEEAHRYGAVMESIFFALPPGQHAAAMHDPESELRKNDLRIDAAQKRVDELHWQIARTEAATAAGIAIKLELAFDGCAEFCINFDDANSLEAALLTSALADARRLSSH